MATKNTNNFMDMMFFMSIPENGSIHKNAGFMHSHGLLCACATSMSFNGEYRDIILIDDIFDELSEASKEFVIAHEQGHIQYGLPRESTTKDFLKYLLHNMFIGPTENEIQADRYAAITLGKERTLQGMQELIPVFKRLKKRSAVTQIKRRMKHVRRFGTED